MTGEEHLAAIKAAVEAAREDGFLLQFEGEWERESEFVILNLAQNRRGGDGVMRRVFTAEIESGWT